MMGQNTSTSWQPRDGFPESRWSFLATGVLVGVLLGAAVTLEAEGRLPFHSRAERVGSALPDAGRRPLPLEWNGARRDLDVRDMFPQRR
jgi:hypothetical protein